MQSLQFRLGLGLLISLFLAFAALWVAASHTTRYLAEEYITTRLGHDTESLLTALTIDKNGSFSIDSSRIGAIYRRPFSGHYYKIIADHTSLRSRSLWDQDLNIKPLPVGQTLKAYMKGPERQPLLVLTSSFNKDDKAFTIAIAEDLSPIKAKISEVQSYFIIAVPLLLLSLIIIQGWILHHSMRPLDKTRKQLKALTKGKLTQLDKDVPAEILPLVDEVNHLLNVLDHRLQRSRNAMGDLAHALKKPLTVLKQYTNSQTITNDPDLRQGINEQLEIAQRHITRMLQRARLAGEGPVGSLFNAAEDLPPLLNMLNAIYHDKSLTIDIQLEENVSILVDREDMLELIGNLLDNACKWATHTVRLTIRQDQQISIIIEDDGPGVEQDQLANLTQRGLRLDEKIDGHGIGLSIVNEIINSLGGSLKFRRSEQLGGLQACITLPK